MSALSCDSYQACFSDDVIRSYIDVAEQPNAVDVALDEGCYSRVTADGVCEANPAASDQDQLHEHESEAQQECDAATESTADAWFLDAFLDKFGFTGAETDQSQPYGHDAGEQQGCEAATESSTSTSAQDDSTSPSDEAQDMLLLPATIETCPALVVDAPATSGEGQEEHITCHLHPRQEDDLEDDADNAPPSLEGAFPLAVSDMLDAFAASLHVTPCTIAAPFLGMIAGLVGGKRLIEVCDIRQPGNLWICVVAPPATGKSRAVRAVTQFFPDVESFYGDLTPAKMLGMRTFTPVAMVKNLAANPQGLLVFPDELSLLLRMFKRDPAFKESFMTSFEGGTLSLERVRQKQCACAPFALTTVISTMTPRGLMETLDWRDLENGFLSRLSVIHGGKAEGVPLLGKTVIEQHHLDLLHTITMNLARMGMNGLDDTRKVVSMSPEAEAAFKRLFDGFGAKAQAHEAEAPLYARLRTRLLRLVLCLHCLKAAINEEDGLALVAAETVRAAEILAKWLEWHERQTLKLVTERPTKTMPSPTEDGQNAMTVAVMRALVDDAQFIEANGGKIPTTRVLEKVKSHLPNATQEGVGRTLKKLLGRRSIRNAGPNQARGFVVLPEEIVAFRTALNM